MHRRYTDRTTSIGGHRIPRGVFVYVLFHHMHNSTKLWDQPDRFLPERWDTEDGSYSPETTITKPKAAGDAAGAAGWCQPQVQVTARAGECVSDADHSAAPYRKFLPFSDGPRSCPGQVCQSIQIFLCCRLSPPAADIAAGGVPKIKLRCMPAIQRNWLYYSARMCALRCDSSAATGCPAGHGADGAQNCSCNTVQPVLIPIGRVHGRSRRGDCI